MIWKAAMWPLNKCEMKILVTKAETEKVSSELKKKKLMGVLGYKKKEKKKEGIRSVLYCGNSIWGIGQ